MKKNRATQDQNGPVTVLLPLTTAAEILGVKFIALVRASQSGKLPVRYASMKPGGTFQAHVSISDIRAYQAAIGENYMSASDYHRAFLDRIIGAKLPSETTILRDLFIPRTSRNGKKKPTRRKSRATSAA